MATKKKLLEAAAGAAAGGEGLNVEQVFSTYLYEGNGASQVINNGIALGDSNAGSSVEFAGGSGTEKQSLSYANNSNYVVGSSSDFTIEFFVFFRKVDDSLSFGLLSGYSALLTGIYISTGSLFGYFQTGSAAQTSISTGQTLVVGQFYHVALVRNGTTFTVYLDGTSVGTVTSSSSVYDASQFFSVGNYTNNDEATINGFVSNLRYSSTARYTSNFTPPTSNFTNDSDTILLSCQGQTADLSSNSIAVTEVGSSPILHDNFGPFTGEDGEGGLVWSKARSSVDGNILIDTERGVNNYISSNSTAGQNNLTLVSSFNSNGHTVSGNSTAVNSNGFDYTSWTFRKAPKFFDVQTWTGTGSARSIPHNIGGTVGSVLFKRTDGIREWYVYHKDVSNLGVLNENYAFTYSFASRGLSSVTSTDIVLSDGNTDLNNTGYTYVAYLFAHNDGDGDFGPDSDLDAIKCGSYTGNGSSQEIDLGFEAQWVLIKNTTNSQSWAIIDNMRGFTVEGENDQILTPNDNTAEAPDNRAFLTSSGFGVNSADYRYNGSGSNYIYIAIRRGPMAVPTDATDVFLPYTAASFDPYYVGFTTDLWLAGIRGGNGANFVASDRLRGNTKYLITQDTSTESTDGGGIAEFDLQYDFDQGFSASSMIRYHWKRAPNYFDVVAYTGDGTSPQNHSHNLGVAPEMMWVRRRNSTGGDWAVYHKDIAITSMLYLNSASSLQTGKWASTAPASTVFTTSGDYRVGANGDTYIAYLFTSLDGVSKVGSFTGNGSTLNVDCGFSSGARFVLIKRASGPWRVFDTARGIVTGNDPFLNLNNSDAETNSADLLDPYSSGFTVNFNSDYGFNTNGDTHYFYAIA